MSLIPIHAYQQSEDKLSVSCYDITGTTSSTAYGVGTNPPVSAFLYCSIDVYIPDSTTLLPVSTITATIDMYPTLPNTSGTPFVITSTDVFGVSQAFPNGEYRFVVTQRTTLDDRGVNYVTDTKVPIIGSVKCCIDNLILAADSCTCGCKDNEELMWASTQLDQLFVPDRSTGIISDAEECGYWNKIADIIINAQNICNSRNCNSCSSCKC